MKILFVVTTSNISEFFDIACSHSGYVTDTVVGEFAAHRMLRLYEYDAIIVEHTPPQLPAHEFIKIIRRGGVSTPVLVLSELLNIENKVNCFNAGCDDFVELPCSGDDLLLRIKLVLNRIKRRAPEHIHVRHLKLEPASQRLLCHNREVYLTRKEFCLLELLLRNRDRVISRSTIVEHVWNYANQPFSNSIETHVSNLRKKIKDVDKNLIVSIPGRGYMCAG